MRRTNDAVLFAAALPRVSKRTRLAKFAQIYRSSGYETAHVGWDRNEDDRRLPVVTCETPSESIVFGGGYASGGLGPRYLLWTMRLAIYYVRNRPRIIHALGLDAALPAVLTQPLSKSVVVFDDADRFSLCHTLPLGANRLLRVLERFVEAKSDIHVVPGLGRYPDGLPSPNTAVLKNTPANSALEAASAGVVEGDSRLTLLFTGWLGDSRGAAVANALAKEFGDEPRVRLLAAGRTTGEQAEGFVSNPGVEYHGEVSNSEAIALNAVSDLVFTLYDPAIEINRFAEPNKWGDCVALGVPFVVNSEVVTAKEYIDGGMALSAAYEKPDAFVQMIHDLLDAPEKVDALKESARQFQADFLPFEDQVSMNLISVLKGLR